MNYFETLPKVNYLFDDQYVKMRNIFYYLKIEFITKEFLKIYRIQETKRIDEISYDIYGMVDYWWLICLINDIKDIIFDLPISDEIVYSIANKYTLAKFGDLTTQEAVDYYVVKLDELIEINESKRVIYIVDPNQISRVLSEITKRF
jgi:hypothetical protein